MAVSKRVVAFVMGVVLIACMSEYILLVPKVFEKLGFIAPVSAVVEEQQSHESINKASIWNRFIEMKNKVGNRFYGIKSKVENKINNIGFKNQFIEINGGFQLILDKNMILDADLNIQLSKMKNGHLSVALTSSHPVSEQANNLIKLDEYVKTKGIDLVYVQAPHKNSKFDNQLPDGVTDYTNQNADEFLSLISENGVDNIDLRQVMYDEGINQYDMFFKTDHHWLPEAGFWATSKITDYLNLNYNYNIPKSICDIENYNIDVYKDIFLGSRAKRVGRLYSGVDDISLIYPKFETNLTFSIPSKDIYKKGAFKDTVFDYEHLQYDYYNKFLYAVYTGGDFPLNIIENKNGNGKKALLIKDSFARVTAPFLSLGFSELDIFDIRHNRDYTVYEYIDISEPDIVIFIYNCDVIISKPMFEFDKIWGTVRK